MIEQELIKYGRNLVDEWPIPDKYIDPVLGIRSKLRRQGYVGQDDMRYGGLDYGNLAFLIKDPDAELDNSFIVSRSQTSHVDNATAEHFCGILGINFEDWECDVRWKDDPTSEFLSHLAMYLDPDENVYGNNGTYASAHEHNHHIFAQRHLLGIPCTDEGVREGTLEMFENIRYLANDFSSDERKIIAMESHPDGIIIAGKDFKEVEDTHDYFLDAALQIDS
jgi:hypothetical protein|tara:strand:- start:495 stop:1160 length:666 start_codon:yes stop_codon:yes gene_type:complete